MLYLIKGRRYVVAACMPVIVIALVFCGLSCRSGNDIQAAKIKYESGQYEHAFVAFKNLAEHGNPEAQFWLGVMFDSGRGINTNHLEAAKWFQKSSDGGYKYAPGVLGSMYFDGVGVTQAYDKALFWLRKGAEMSDPLAEGLLGLMYKKGKGVAQDYSIAVTWFERASKQEFTSAQVNLAFCLESGLGVEQDIAKAFALYCKAAERGDVLGQLYVARAYRYGIGTASDKQKALEYYELAAKQNYGPAVKELEELKIGVQPPEVVRETIPKVAKLRYERIKDISAHRNIPVPHEFHWIMECAIKADWPAVSYGYDRIWKRSHQYQSDEPADPKIANELWHPLHDTYWTFKYLMDWSPELVRHYTDAVLNTLPNNSVLFTGSDSTRFLVASMADITGRTNIVFISQNALVDNSYMDYMEDIYGHRLWIPTESQRNNAFRRFAEDVREGVLVDHAASTTNGQVSIDGLTDLMRINGYLSEMIVKTNRPSHRFFVDEGYVIPWMDSYLKPHGLIMELMPELVDTLSEKEVQADTAYWKDTEKRLLDSQDFVASRWPRQAYGMMRSAIAGLYAHHQMYESAEKAFRQAIRLSPDFPEPEFRLAVQVFAPQGRTNEALALLERLRDKYPENTNYKKYIDKLKTGSMNLELVAGRD